MKKKTVGQQIVDVHSKPQYEAELGDMMPKESERYLKELHDGVLKGKQKFEGDFFIEFCLKKERLMPQILPRLYAIPRKTCPTPFYDQDCYRYVKEDDALEFIWSVPSPETCADLKLRCLKLDEIDREVLKFVYDYYDGTLLKMCKDFNGEKIDSIELRDHTFKG
jgi:hypothetical protein